MGCIKRITGCFISIIIFLVVVAGAIYLFILPQITSRIEDGLRRKLMLGPSASVEITDTGFVALSQGRIEHVSVVAEEARVNNYVVKNLTFEADGLTFDLIRTVAFNDPAIKSLGEGELEFFITAQALEDAWEIAAAKIGISDLTLTVIPADLAIKLEGSWKISWLNAEYPFEATGKLNLKGGSFLFFEVPEIKVGKLDIGVGRLQSALASVSPNINLGDYKLSITLDDIQFSEDGLRIRAQAHGEE